MNRSERLSGVSDMASEWPAVPLGELYSYRSGLSKPRSAFGSGFGFLSFKDVFYNFFVPDELSELVQSTEKERDASSVRRGDVFLTRTSETMEELGMSSVALRDYEGATFNGFCKRLRPLGSDTVVPEYAAYYFRSPLFRQAVTAMSSMSTRASLNNGMLDRLTILLPPRPTQRAIAAVLKALDDKIDVNRKMNRTLEEMAQAIFKSWFIDYDGHDELVGSELGPIPKGWEVRRGDQIADVAIGKTPPRKEREWFSTNPADIRWMSIRDMGKCGAFIIETAEHLTEAAIERFRVRRIPPNTVVLSFKLTVGRVAITDGEMLSNEAIAHFKLASGADLTPHFLYCYLSAFRYETLGSTSSIARAVNSKMIKAMPILVPSRSAIARFEGVAAPLFQRMKANAHESRTLAALRDALLPKLISGKLRVPEDRSGSAPPVAG